MGWRLFVVFICYCLVQVLEAQGSRWATPDQEAQDEIHDREILQAVIKSMEEWHQRRMSRRHKRAESMVCYADVGCFMSAGPFGYLDMLPSPPDEVGTMFFFHSRINKDIPRQVPFTNMTSVLLEEGFNSSLPTKVIIHGFGSSCSHVWVYEMRSALMTVEDCNVICVHWETGAAIPNYVRAAANTRLVGKQVAMLVSMLHEKYGLPIHRVHLIGFSLGAHAAGFAGAELKNLSRITGLDPAGPLFENQDPRARLDSTDAMFVDVIHSNGENLILGGLGAWQPMGHVDFYPNGGRMQKGCSNLFVGAVSDILWSSEGDGRSLCNHRRAYKFFTDSVSPICHFPAFSCESYDDFLQGKCFPCSSDNNRKCGNMGYYADRSPGRGTLYLVTREEEPFCANQYHLKVESSPSLLPIVSYGKIQVTLIGTAEINETFTLTHKDDEELEAGGSLSRIVVPHPVMVEPIKVQLLYTAYSGWISSGLARWSIDKVTISDSFGKSLSFCKKGLVMVSGEPITVPLYPGNCNPPRIPPPSTPDGWPSTGIENDVRNYVVSQGTETPVLQAPSTSILKGTPVVKIGDEDLAGLSEPDQASTPVEVLHLGLTGIRGSPWYSPESDSVHDNVSNSLAPDGNREDAARSFSPPLIVPKILLKNHTAAPANSTHNLSSPVLLIPTKPVNSTSDATSESAPSRPDISRVSSVRPRHIPKWLPSIDLSPPPIQPVQSWDQWRNTGTSGTGRSLSNTSGDLAPSFQHKTAQSAPQPIMVQFLPPRLATLLTQAEEYAKLTFSHTISPPQPAPLASNNAPQAFLIHSARLAAMPYAPTANEDSKRRPKYFPPLAAAEVIPLHPRSPPNFYRRGLERPATSVYQPRADVNVGGSIQFPAQVVPDATKYQSRYIPLRAHHRVSDGSVTVKPEFEETEHQIDVSRTYHVSNR